MVLYDLFGRDLMSESAIPKMGQTLILIGHFALFP